VYAVTPGPANATKGFILSETTTVLDSVIHHIETCVPESAYSQAFIGEVMKSHLRADGSTNGSADGKTERLLNRIYRHSGIEKRHSVIPDYTADATKDGIFFDPGSGTFLSPGTGARNEIYTREARTLFTRVAAAAIDNCSGFDRDDITHVITASCTGFFAPGPDYHIVCDLGLDPSTERVHVGFMGCYAAFPALRMARAFCSQNPDAVVLIACVELCTLHLEPSDVLDNIIACSVFADGAAAAIVSNRKPSVSDSKPTLLIEELHTTLAPDSEADMAWTIGDRGFNMVLSTYVPRILETNVASIVDELLRVSGHIRSDVDRWAIHPGGRAILDNIARALDLDGSALDVSRKILREYGNMSSATVLFVLDEILSDSTLERGDRICALAFGPGLTVESGVLRIV
jgi:predicted naringenin-chalcone synthase